MTNEKRQPERDAMVMQRGGLWGRLLNESTVAFVIFLGLAVYPIAGTSYSIYTMPQYMSYGLLALSLAFLWGNGGIVSFGQAAFFAIGGYAVGIAYKYIHIAANVGYIGFVAGVVAAMIVALLAGYFLFSGGVRASHFVLITMALSIIGQQLAVSFSSITGGYNGMYLMRLPWQPWQSTGSMGDVALYYFALVLMALVYIGMTMLLRSDFGKVLNGIRVNEDRVLALGYRASWYKTAAFAVSGGIAGLAGALYGTASGFMAPPTAGILLSTNVVLWTTIGGRYSLLGGLAGGMVIASLSDYLNSLIPDYWQLILGVVFIIALMSFREGLAGLAGSMRRWALSGPRVGRS